ncbi:restriction endonuclease [Gluconobacter sp. NFX36]|uniref:restriction endonuclease n=1 Tax=Gluconobacter sp. NFX36 TaxID=2819535 RepID=UPI003CECA60E
MMIPNVKTGLDFERYCFDQLQIRGWSVRHIGAAGDFGCDLLATTGKSVVAIQCKYYSKPVGPKCVQEVFASLHYHRATHAAVVCNSGFTAACRKLAAATKVALVEADNLGSLTERLGVDADGIRRTPGVKRACIHCRQPIRVPLEGKALRLRCTLCWEEGMYDRDGGEPLPTKRSKKKPPCEGSF